MYKILKLFDSIKTRGVMVPTISRRCRAKAHGEEVVLLEISISDTSGEKEMVNVVLSLVSTTCLRFAAIKRYGRKIIDHRCTRRATSKGTEDHEVRELLSTSEGSAKIWNTWRFQLNDRFLFFTTATAADYRETGIDLTAR